MLRKLSRKLSGARTHDNEEEFASIDARQHDHARREVQAQAVANRPTASRTVTFSQYNFELEDELANRMQSFQMGRALDALDLTSLVDPSLTRMRPFVAPAEALLPDAPQRRGSAPAPGMRSEPLSRPALAAAPLRRLDRDAVILRRPIPGITVTPADDIPNPMDTLEDPTEALDFVTPLPTRGAPQRPLLRRNALSYRDQRDIPLRVQAVRRAHQEEYARQISRRPLLAQVPRRGSEPVMARNARVQLTPDVGPQQPMQRRPSQAAVDRQRQQRPGHNTDMARRGSSSRVEHLNRPQLGRGHSMRQRDYFAESSQNERDFYLEAASAEWDLGFELQTM